MDNYLSNFRVEESTISKDKFIAPGIVVFQRKNPVIEGTSHTLK